MTNLQRASNDRAAGLGFIIGAIALIVTMAIHPTAPDFFAPGRMSHAIRLDVIAHSLGLCSIPILFLGALGLSLRIRPIGRLPIAALVVFGFASIAVMSAAIFSGFIAPAIARQIVAPNADPSWRMAFHLCGQINQGFALVYVQAASAAILLWSIWMLRSHVAAPGIFVYGTISAPLTLLVVMSGHIRLDVHGFGAIALGQGIWFIGTGMWLHKQPKESAA
jgi:energy-converting hydrogenase Eha subunit C